jgi:hypothetical protein|tara:strand:+ start:946 stop:1149 length:204 start_codon:yes stop_codon:yes gene_type:complete
MSNSISKYYDQQEDLQISNRRAKIRTELTSIRKETGLIGDPDLSNLEWFLNNREKIIKNRKIIDLIG